MLFIKAKPNQYIVSGRNGRIVNRGLAASAFRWPGHSFLTVPSSQQECCFEMTQESSDGIPLRFKGLVVFRIVRPEASAQLFDFSNHTGLEQIGQLLSHLCLGELRACVSGLTMKQCIEERKTTLTEVVQRVLSDTVNRSDDKDWGLSIDVVQVAQVFVTDSELRRQLEAETRDEVRSASELSAMRVERRLMKARLEAEQESLEHSLITSREKARIEKEEQEFALQLERTKAENRHRLREEALQRETPLKLQEFQSQMELIEQRRKLLESENEMKLTEADLETKIARQKQDLRKEILALEQAPQIAQAMAGMFSGSHLSFWGEEPSLFGPLSQILARLQNSLDCEQ